MSKEQLKRQLLYKTSKHIDDAIEIHNAITGDDKNYLYYQLKRSIEKADKIDIIVSFLMESGVKLLLKDLKQAIERGVEIRLLTGNYLGITEPSALYLIREALGSKLDLRFYRVSNRSFHPKSYMFHNEEDSEIYIGSSNLSRGALTDSIEWNYRFYKSANLHDFEYFYKTFEDLFYNHSQIIDEEVLRNYSKSWCRPKAMMAYTDRVGEEEENIRFLYEPRGAQIEALYALENTRMEGWDKGIVVAATGIGKTYLAAFDSKKYKRILFVAHREEILKQAEASFRNVRHTDKTSYFYGSNKEVDGEVVFALVQTLGKKEYLNEKYFSSDTFDYIVIDECHHATAKQYEAIRNYFKPKFTLFLTATPERMDNQDVFAIADWNCVYEVRLHEAINKDWLTPFRYYGIYDTTVDYDKIDYSNGKYNKEQLDTELMASKRCDLVLGHYNKYGSKCAMGFCSSKEHASYMAGYFTSKGIPSVAVYSGEQGNMTAGREEAIEKLINGAIKIIFSVDMFNEGIDIPQIDMVMFLRPTQSPTIFLQQLGRGLRKAKGKTYVNVLDFIGNYKKAQLIPFLLGEKNYTPKEGKDFNPQTMPLPQDCLVDFDFRLIDMFKEMSKQSMNLKAQIVSEYGRITDKIGKRPSRYEYFIQMDENIYMAMRKQSKENIFSDYLGFLNDRMCLKEDEVRLTNHTAYDFIQMLETTSMSRTYKMPLFLAFIEDGKIKEGLTEKDVIEAFKTFYDKDSNSIDLLQDGSKQNYRDWEDKKWLKLIKDNPVKALLKSAHFFFEEKEGYVIGIREGIISDELNDIIVEHVKDVIDYRLAQYYRERFVKKMEDR